MKHIIILILFFNSFLQHSLLTAQEKQNFINRNIPVEFKFSAPATLNQPNLTGYQLLIYQGPFNKPLILNLNNNNDSWETTFTVTDSSVKIIFYAFQATYKDRPAKGPIFQNGDYQHLMLMASPKVPVRDAWHNLALSYTNSSILQRENSDEAFFALEKELELYPDNYPARRLQYTLLVNSSTNKKTAVKAIMTDLNQLLGSGSRSLDLLNFAVSMLEMIGEKSKAADITREIIAKYPASQAAAQFRFSEIMKIEDTGSRALQLEEFLRNFTNPATYEYALAALATTDIELNDQTNMIKTGNLLLAAGTGTGSAAALAGLAGALIESHYHQDKAEEYAVRAIELVDKAADKIPSGQMTETEWLNELQNTKARYLDILGWIRVSRGNSLAGLADLKKAAANSSQPGTYFHLGIANENIGHIDDALQAYARGAVFDGEIGEMAYDAFISLWKKDNRSNVAAELYLDQQGDIIEKNFKEKILAAKIQRKAPDFELEDLAGGDWIKLSDQKGIPMVLCFWAAWSKSSHLLLRELNSLADLYGQDILFMTIATDKNPRRVTAYMKKFKTTLPVLFNNKTDLDYKIKGVPMLYVLDRQLNINFIHRGYRPDIKEKLSIELDEVLK